MRNFGWSGVFWVSYIYMINSNESLTTLISWGRTSLVTGASRFSSLQAKLVATTIVNPPVNESEEEDEEDNSQRSTPVLGTSSQQDNPQPSKSSTRAKTARSKPKTATLTSLQRRVDESKKLTECIEAMMEDAEDSQTAQMQYGVLLASMVPQIKSSLTQDYYKQLFVLMMQFVDNLIAMHQQQQYGLQQQYGQQLQYGQQQYGQQQIYCQQQHYFQHQYG